MNSSSAIKVGLVGAGCMGRGIAFQVNSTPGMSLSWVADLDPAAASETAALAPGAQHHTDCHHLLKNDPIDVFVEATNSIGPAAEYCLAAIHSGAHCVLMNAEVDHGGKEWESYNKLFRDQVLNNQNKDGTYKSVTESHGLNKVSFSEHYRTCLATLMLETYYRFLPGTGAKTN